MLTKLLFVAWLTYGAVQVLRQLQTTLEGNERSKGNSYEQLRTSIRSLGKIAWWIAYWIGGAILAVHLWPDLFRTVAAIVLGNLLFAAINNWLSRLRNDGGGDSGRPSGTDPSGPPEPDDSIEVAS